MEALCQSGPRKLKRSGECAHGRWTLLPVFDMPVACYVHPRFALLAGSIANNKLPEGIKQYWNYESKSEKLRSFTTQDGSSL